MTDMMQFPDTFEEFINDYSFKDTDEVYTNGSELIPVFRLMQGVEHYFQKRCGEWKEFKKDADYTTYECSVCGNKVHVAKGVNRKPNFCNMCGAEMRVDLSSYGEETEFMEYPKTADENNYGDLL